MTPTPNDLGSVHLDSDRAELLERRLAEQVDVRVRHSLFKFYAAVGVAVAAVATYAGWDFVQGTKKDIHDLAATQAKNMVDEQVMPAVKLAQKTIHDAEEKMNEITINIRVAEDLQHRAMLVMDDLDHKLAEFSPKARLLDEFAAKVDKLNADQQGLEARLQGASDVIGTLESVTKNEGDLARTVDSISQAVTSLSKSLGSTQGNQQAAKINTDLKSVITASEQAYGSAQAAQLAQSQTIVYFQFSGMTQDTAEKIKLALQGKHFRVPGAENAKMPASGLFEIRYYWPEDASEADRLASDAVSVLQSQAIKVDRIEVRDYTGYSKAKPKKGIIELWVGMPTVAAD